MWFLADGNSGQLELEPDIIKQMNKMDIKSDLLHEAISSQNQHNYVSTCYFLLINVSFVNVQHSRLQQPEGAHFVDLSLVSAQLACVMVLSCAAFYFFLRRPISCIPECFLKKKTRMFPEKKNRLCFANRTRHRMFKDYIVKTALIFIVSLANAARQQPAK